MPRNVRITIDKDAELRRFLDATYKTGRAIKQDAAMQYNMQADSEESPDEGFMEASFARWYNAGVQEMREFVMSHDSDEVNLTMPSNWGGSEAALAYSLKELVHNGMLGDWYDDVKQDIATAYKKKAVLNQAEIRATVYALNPPTMQ